MGNWEPSWHKNCFSFWAQEEKSFSSKKHAEQSTHTLRVLCILRARDRSLSFYSGPCGPCAPYGCIPLVFVQGTLSPSAPFGCMPLDSALALCALCTLWVQYYSFYLRPFELCAPFRCIPLVSILGPLDSIMGPILGTTKSAKTSTI